MTAEECVFCKPATEYMLGIVKNCRVVRNRTNKAKLLIIPIQHEDRLIDLDSPGDIFEALSFVAKTLELKNYHVLMNQGRFRHIHHAHIHIINEKTIPEEALQKLAG